jgi:hypothetical protein
MLDFMWLAVGAGALFLLPGYALLALARNAFPKSAPPDWMERLALALGLSLAVVPLLLYALTLVGIRQGPGVVWALLGICALVIVWRRFEGQETERSNEGSKANWWIYGTLALVFAITLFSRLWSVRDIDFPAWTDSYGHAVIAQMVLDQGGVPTSYEPYAPIDDFTYHFGFHALAAWYHWLTGVPLLYGMVILGQLLNALVVPTTYLFVARFFNSRVAALVAVVVVALLSHMPAQFVNWGRFTQIDGQMLLPVAVTLYLVLLRSPVPRYRLLLLAVVAFAGLFVAHYRVFIFGVLLAAILWAWAMLKPSQGQNRGRLLLETAALTLLGLLVLSPWLWRLAQGFGGNFANTMVSGYEEQQYGAYYNFDPKELVNFGVHGYLWIWVCLSALWGLWRRNGMVIALLLWMAAMFAGANLHYLNFTPLYSNTIVIIALYLPLCALIGYGGAEVVSAASARWTFTPGVQRGMALASFVVVAILGIYAIERDARLVERENVFVREGDRRAMQWIREEVPADALFYIATTFWTPGVAHGLDGGYYLPLLTARQTIMPPQHYASDGSGEYRAFVVQRLHDLDAAQDADALWAMLNHYEITHIYIGVRKTQLDPAFFAARPDLFAPLYEADGVYIFAVNPDSERSQ